MRLGLTIISLGAVAVPGHRPAISPGALPEPCAFDTAAATRSIPITFYIAAPSSLPAAAAVQARFFAAALASYYRGPSRLAVDTRPIVHLPEIERRPDSVSLHVGGPLMLPLKPNGTLADSPIALTALWDLNETLVAAARERDTEGPVPVAAWLASVGTGPVDLEVEAAAVAPPGSHPIIKVNVPVYLAESGPSPDQFARPVYPERARDVGVMARVDLRYVISEAGRAIPGSVEVLRVLLDGDSRPGMGEQFAESAIRAITSSRFKPARVRGCPVATQIRQRISFAIGS